MLPLGLNLVDVLTSCEGQLCKQILDVQADDVPSVEQESYEEDSVAGSSGGDDAGSSSW